MTIGERIRSRRKELNLTMKDIFSKEKIQTGNLSELENDKYLPSVQTLISLSNALDCSIDWILTGCEHHQQQDESLEYRTLKSEQGLMCDGSPLDDMEADLIAMFRLLPESHREEVFNMAYFKYRNYVEKKKESIYSTYGKEANTSKSGTDDDGKPCIGTA